ncbi:putative HET domain-containing protein [Rosellinia necatrix]|uniref:Putative HET domain-containing protein n=1 Tax=Rosellinia necatrix TaxID=77044 RepID=A0A1W2TU48_ROSNE|nr:putative HET domain-containing protein [Rosellinia necatrix]
MSFGGSGSGSGGGFNFSSSSQGFDFSSNKQGSSSQNFNHSSDEQSSKKNPFDFRSSDNQTFNFSSNSQGSEKNPFDFRSPNNQTFNFSSAGQGPEKNPFDFRSPNNQTFNFSSNGQGSDKNPFDFGSTNDRTFNFSSAGQGSDKNPFDFRSPNNPGFDFNNLSRQGANNDSPNPDGSNSRASGLGSGTSDSNFASGGAPLGGPSRAPASTSTSASAPAPAPAPPPAELCPECAALDLETAFARAHALYEGARRGRNVREILSCRSRTGPTYLRDFYFVASLGARLAEDRAWCRLCSFFRQHADDPGKGTYKVLAICSSESHLFEPPRKTARGKWVKRPWVDMEYNVFLAVVPEVADIPRTGVPLRWLELDLPRKGAIYRLTEYVDDEDERRLVLPRKLEPKVNRFILHYWEHTCSDIHGTRCKPKKSPGASLRGFRAIDCSKRPPIVRDIPWSEKYVALSYVWGSGSEQWPQTVKDAVVVTRIMGYNYLWVDRLCIDQSNPDEQMFLISKMDAIYEGAELTIVNAAGDARAGLPGIWQTPRTPQPSVELNLPKGKSTAGTGDEEDEYLELLNVPRAEYEQETAGHTGWLDTYRFGLNNTMAVDMDEMLQLAEGGNKWGLPRDHLDFFEDSAQHFGTPLDEFMAKQEELARRMGIPLTGLVPHFQREAARRAGFPVPDGQPLPPLQRPSQQQQIAGRPSAVEAPLPPGKVPGKTVLVSTMRDPRAAIRASRWYTRGWTYQEGVLARRCLVFTPEQVYWECRGMAAEESLDLPLTALHDRHVGGDGAECWAFGDYMLSGVLRGGAEHRTPELRYGFPDDDNGGGGGGSGEGKNDEGEDNVAAQVKALDAHVRAFTSRRLTNSADSWNAFLGVAARYTGNARGLSLVLGIPYWAGAFADGAPALQHSFAMSVSVWFHVGRPSEPGSRLYVADCARRAQFPSWSWIGWEGTADLNDDNTVSTGDDADGDDDDDFDDEVGGEDSHVNFFMAKTSSSWATSINFIWAAEMLLHSEDGSASTVLQGDMPLHGFVDPTKKWLLTIRKPLVLRHLYLMHTRDSSDWRRLMGKLVELHLSVMLTEEELTAGHKSGDFVSVLVFASTVPFVWDGRARFLILRKARNTTSDRWERIGRLILLMEEHVMDGYNNSQDMVNNLPVRSFGSDITLD